MRNTEAQLQNDIRMIGELPFIPALLDLVCAATGMGFAAVARVTEERWIAGSVRDQIRFGLAPGDELPVASTICHEIRQQEREVVIDSVSRDAVFCNHHTPATYGFESYVSFPIIGRRRGFFGTLCAINPKARQLNTPEIQALFRALTEVIAAYVDTTDDMPKPAEQHPAPGIESTLVQALAAIKAGESDKTTVLRTQIRKLQRLAEKLAPVQVTSNAE